MRTDVQEAVKARADEPFLERFIEAYQPFILRAASQSAGFSVTRSDDEYSVALLAFYEAVKTYDAANSSFGTYARLVIGRRLTDYYRTVRRFDAEISLAPQTFDGAVETEQPDAAMQMAVVEKMAAPAPADAAEEIRSADAMFREYGFTFYDLEKCAPHADKTRKSCAAVIAVLLYTPSMLAEMRRTRGLPIRELAQQSSVSRKLIERHRRYIIATALLLDGEYPALAEYLQPVRTEIAGCRK